MTPLLFVLLLCSAASGWGQVSAMPEHVSFKRLANPIVVAAGRPAKVTLEFQVAPSYHINSNKPTTELLVPTELRLSPPTDIAIGQLKYPAGTDTSFDFAPGETLNVYAGKFVITAVVGATKIATPGTYRVHGTLKYQACNNRACYPPKRLPVDFDVKVNKAKGSSNAPRHTGQSPHIHN